MHAPESRSYRLTFNGTTPALRGVAAFSEELRRNRRHSHRHPVGFYVEQIINDAPHRCFTSNLSSVGLYMERLAEPLQRSNTMVQLEIPLPNTGDSLWAKAEVVYDRFDSLFHGTAVRFTAMARQHERLLREWLRYSEHGERFASLNRLRPRVRIVRPALARA